MQWFGTSWNAPINSTTPQCSVPVGIACGDCGQLIKSVDSGVVLPLMTPQADPLVSGAIPYARFVKPPWVAYHLRCFLHAIGVG